MCLSPGVGIGEIDGHSIHGLVSKELFGRWLLCSRVGGDDERSPRSRSGDSVAFRVLRECVPRAAEANCDMAKLQADVDKLYADIVAQFADRIDSQILHKSDLAKYFTDKVSMKSSISVLVLVSFGLILVLFVGRICTGGRPTNSKRRSVQRYSNYELFILRHDEFCRFRLMGLVFTTLH